MKKQRVVVKIGSSSLTDKHGGLDLHKLMGYVRALVALREDGHEVVLISSGAVASGFSRLGYPARPTTMAGKQASAAVGQALLMQHYVEGLYASGIVAAQILLTRPDFQNEAQYSNAYQALEELLKRGVIPIINENDTTSVAELTFGDNDMLSALVSGLIKAQTLCILTDVDGIYDANPKTNPDAKRYQYLPDIPEELLAMSGETGSNVGTGGMKSKVMAAKTAMGMGVNVFIGMGTDNRDLVDILAGKGAGTYIGHQGELEGKVKQWIRLHSSSSGSIRIDAGAERAILQEGKSLLPAGVTAVKGDFQNGDVVSIENEKGKIVAKGQVTVSSELLEQVQGKRSSEARELVGMEKSVVIHRSRLVEVK
ncbi:MAG: glutamate 5-kinase [Turicibacter sp.]|nr:glutamate 5-kinase [Turicibacter sp.]